MELSPIYANCWIINYKGSKIKHRFNFAFQFNILFPPQSPRQPNIISQ